MVRKGSRVRILVLREIKGDSAHKASKVPGEALRELRALRETKEIRVQQVAAASPWPMP